jgi:ribosomal protein S18 acetylase RimI-like enzyme
VWFTLLFLRVGDSRDETWKKSWKTFEENERSKNNGNHLNIVMLIFGKWLMEADSIAERLRIEHKFGTERTKRGTFPDVIIDAYVDDTFVGDLHVVKDGEWVAYGVRVLPDWQRRGIATQLYNYAEKLLGVKLKPSSSQTDDGKAFWQARLQNEPQMVVSSMLM